MAEKPTWIITASGSVPLDALKLELMAKGFAINQSLDEIGVLTGQIDTEAVHALRTIDGVRDVSAEHPVDIGRPDTPDTW